MFAVVEIDPFRGLIEIARQHDAVFADDRQLERVIGKELAIFRPQRHVEAVRVLDVGIAHIDQGLIGGADRADDLLLEGAGEIGVVLQGGALGARLLFRQAVDDAAPDQGDREEAGQHARIKRKPAQGFATARGKRPAPLLHKLAPTRHAVTCLSGSELAKPSEGDVKSLAENLFLSSHCTACAALRRKRQ